jgi:hypothetical protein
MLELPFIMLFLVSVPLQVGEVIEEEIEGMIDLAVDNIEIPENNPLNATKTETDELKHSGKSFLMDLLSLMSSTHSVAEDTVEVVSPYEIDDFTLLLIGIGLMAVIIIPIIKKIGMHLLYMIVVAIVIVVVLVLFDINSEAMNDVKFW